jgi:hypothetical protein
MEEKKKREIQREIKHFIKPVFESQKVFILEERLFTHGMGSSTLRGSGT